MRYEKSEAEAFEDEVMQTQLEIHGYASMKVYEELYGNIGQLLSSTKLLIGLTKRKLSQVPETLVTADKTIGKAIRDLRLLSRPLRKEWIRDFMFIENLETEITRINDSRTLPLVVYVFKGEAFCLLPAKQLMFFRIVQEGLQNAVNHSGAQKIVVTISNTKKQIRLTINDDGKGFSISKKAYIGLGIITMRYRTRLLGGTIQWHSLPGEGTKVKIQIPGK
jgi:signal transduction histidine kinase